MAAHRDGSPSRANKGKKRIRVENKFTVLVVGGARSGKSRYAHRLAEKCFKAPLYLATAEVTDEEMRERIRLHRSERGEKWRCAEEPLDIARVLRGPGDCDGVLLDCVTVWLGNVLYHEDRSSVEARKAALIDALSAADRSVIIVSNEVGQGIVPADASTREFRDLAGWLNQDLAKAVDAVVFVACGLPMVLKGREIIEQLEGAE
jgi:adenosylcobinamide kinase/adenosylcobinamide-phosphate guanylyltransferase